MVLLLDILLTMEKDILNKRIDNFDYLRIICSALLVFYHYQMNYKFTYNPVADFYGGVIKYEYIVELFFVMSGFLAAGSRNDKSFKVSVISKWIRLYPIAYIATSLSVINLILAHVIYGFDPLSYYSVESLVFSSLIVHQGWIFTWDYALNAPTWYICVLMVTFIIFYGIEALSKKVALGRGKDLIYILMMLLALALHGLELPFFKLKSCQGYLAFFAGVLIYKIYKTLDSKKNILIGAMLFCMGLLLVVFSFRIPIWNSLSATVIHCGVVLMAASMRQFPSKAASYLGAISFELYLFHVPAIELSNLFTKLAGLSYKRSFVTMVIFLVATEFLAHLIHKYIGKPLTGALNKKLNAR